ncbi:laccase 14 [Actinidia rufa]|uniref:laccase n=1 Tax=Actinidia rufa TaxID=165716 RepID=A0A7J0E2G0_9ERIC|nr:laccase 14 [Actinidia rufa]
MELIETALEQGGETNKSDALTINGQPGDKYNCSKQGTYKLTVDYGKTYLLRVINAIMNEEVFFGLAKHNLTVIGMDGAYIKPLKTDYIIITPGQTMDILFTANRSPSHYYMAARASAAVAYDNTTTTAVVKYSGNYTAPSTPTFPSLPDYEDIDAVTNFTRPDGSRLAASLNNVSFEEPDIDLLQAYYRGIGGVFETDFPSVPPRFFNFTADEMPDNVLIPLKGTKVKVLKFNSTVEIVFQGTNVQKAAENHPMHLHGYSFYVVGSGFGNFNNVTDPKSYNLVDPPEVNTVGVPKNGWAAIRFRADNPGVWFMHCHLERHSSWGMDTAIIVKNGTTRLTSMRRAPHHLNPC